MKTVLAAFAASCLAMPVQAASVYDVSLSGASLVSSPGAVNGTVSISGYFTVDETAGRMDGLVGSVFTDPNNGASFTQFDELTDWSFTVTGSGGVPSFTISSTDTGASDAANTQVLTGLVDNRVSIGGGLSADFFDFRVLSAGVTNDIQFGLKNQIVTVFTDAANTPVAWTNPTTSPTVPTITYRQPNGDISVVPLPATVWLMAAALGGLGLTRRRK